MEHIRIQSDINNLIAVEQLVDSVCDHRNIHNYSATITIALLKAVENAIVHGNKNNPSKTVSISVEDFTGGVSFTIRDQGEGFDFNSYGDFSSISSGVGLFLMHTLSDRLLFSDNGSCVRLDFFIEGIDPAVALERVSVLNNFWQHKVELV